MICSQCGTPLPPDAPGGHCPHCLIRTSVLLSGHLTESEGTPGPLFVRDFGDYELEHEIARGGMGVVYRARQRSLGRTVAVKLLLGGEFAGPGFVRRFRREAEAAARLRHPNIVAIHEFGHHDGQPFLAMALIEGRSLAEEVRHQPLPARRAATYLAALARAVAFAHAQGILHRDLKPSNVLIDAVTDQPLITDFGLAKRLTADEGDGPPDDVDRAPADALTRSGHALGSPSYMAPEQAAGRGEVGPPADLYSLGALLYHLLTGRPPFQSDSLAETLRLVHHGEPVPPRRLNPSVPLDLQTLCLKCLEKDPARRYASAAELADELDRFLSDRPIRARPLSAVARVARFCRRRPAIAGLGITVLALLGVVLAGSLVAAWRIDAARRSERHERQRYETANLQLQHTVDVLELQRAEEAFRARDPSLAVAHLAFLLRRAPSNHIAAARLVSALAHSPWLRRTLPPTLHPEGVQQIHFRPDGQQWLTVTRSTTAHLVDATSGRMVATLPHGGRVFTGRYSPDGRQVITAGEEGAARLWNTSDGTAVREFRHAGPVHWAEFGGGPQRAITAGGDGFVRIWETTTGRCELELGPLEGAVVRAFFSPDHLQLATVTESGSVQLWETATGGPRETLPAPPTRVHAAAFSPDGAQLAAGGEGGLARVWFLNSPARPPLTLAHAPWAPVWQVAFSPDGKALLTTAEDGTARLWDATTGLPLSPPLSHEGGVVHGVFSPDGEWVVTTSADVTARLWHWRSGQPFGQPLRHLEPVRWAVFSADQRRVITASDDHTIQAWDLPGPVAHPVELRHRGEATSVAWVGNGSRLLTTSLDGTARLWSPGPQGMDERLLDHPAPVTGADLSTDGRHAVTATTEGTTWVWDLTSGQRTAGPATHARAVASVRFSPDHQRFVTASLDGTARVWETSSARATSPPLTHEGPVTLAVFDSSGGRVATASEDGSARVWEASSGRPLSGPLRHQDHVKWVDFSPDGTHLVTASTDNSAILWDVDTGRPRGPALQHARIVEMALFSPDGRRVVTASQDRTARVWDAVTGQAVTPPMPHLSAASQVVFSPDGRRVITGGWNSLVRVWDADTGLPLTEWLSVGGGVTRLAMNPTGTRLAAASRSGMVKVWDLPAAPVPVPQWLPTFAEEIAGTRWNDHGHLERLPQSAPVLPARDPHSTEATQAFYERLARWRMEGLEDGAAGPF